MSKLTKLLATLLVTVVLTGLLAACGSPGDGIKTTGEMKYDEAGNPVYTNVDIDLASVVTGEDASTFSTIVAKFNREYDGKIYVNLKNIAQDQFEKTVGNAIQTNVNAPDLIMCHYKSHLNFASQQLIQPFNEGFEAAKITYKKSDLVAAVGANSDLGYEGEQYQIPIDARSMAVYYNKDILSELNKEVPTTYEELINVCAAFREKYSNDNYYAIVADTETMTYFWDYVFPTAVIQNGGTLYDTETYKAEWSSGENLQAFKDASKVFRTLKDNHYAMYSSSTNASNAFYENRALLLIDRPWSIKSILQGYSTKNSDKSVMDVVGGASLSGLFALDSSKATAKAVYGDGHGFIMSRTVTDITRKAAICEFVNWYTTNVETGTTWAEAGHTSVNKTVINSSDYQNNIYISNYTSKFYTDLDMFYTLGNNLHYSEIILNLSDAGKACVGTTIGTGETLEGVVENVVAKYQKIYNDYVDLYNLMG